MHIVLVEPEIPQNTGNIARTCSVTGCTLHLVHPLGFSTEDKYLKRAGLDYWDMLDIYHYDSLAEVLEQFSEQNIYYTSTRAAQGYHQVEYSQNDVLVFGKETAGLPVTFLEKNYDSCIRIPMINEARSLNLANSVAIILYEALRQTGFSDFKIKGNLPAIKTEGKK